MQLFDYKVQALKYCLPYLRTNKDVCTVLKAIGERYNVVQAVILYLLNTLRIEDARGVWLDYIGREVGALRDDADYSDYFCTNVDDINREKLFYFISGNNTTDNNTASLNDADFIKKIQAYIASNTSSGTRNEIINIVKFLTGATSVIITKTDTCTLSINLIGDDITSAILTENMVNYIRRCIGDGVYLEGITVNE